MSKFKDYDALAAEKEPFAFRVGGRDFKLPPELPARLALDLRRQTRQEMSDAEAEDFGFRVVEALVGSSEDWEYIVDHIGVGGLAMFVQDVLSHYGLGGADEGGEAPKETAGPGESPSTTSSSITEPSRATSNVFGLRPIEDSEQVNFPGDAFSPASRASLPTPLSSRQ